VAGRGQSLTDLALGVPDPAPVALAPAEDINILAAEIFAGAQAQTG
jgi:hypothetical protein